MLLALLGAIAIGLSLGIMGSGGSILTVPVLIYVLGHADKPAIAESLAIVGGIALIGAIPGAFARRIHWRTVALFGVPAMAGTYLGAWASLWVPGTVQLLIFAVVMLLAAGLMLRGSSAPPTRGRSAGGGAGGCGAAGEPTPSTAGRGCRSKPPPHPQAGERHGGAALVMAEGLGVGVLTGLVGVGGGFLIVPALVLLGGLGMHRAVATSLVIIVFKSGAGFWKYLGVLHELDLQVDWNTIGLFILVGGVGAMCGARFGGRVDQASLKRAFGVFLIVMGVAIGWREVDRLTSRGAIIAEPVSADKDAVPG
jgi:uncharacterized membrane protein YfcA